MKRRLLALLLTICLCLQLPIAAFASGRTVHDKHLESVVFGRSNYHVAQETKQKEAIEVLECAAYLCPDQYNEEGQTYLDKLHTYGVPGIPASIGEIDFSSNYTHRKYSHLGWVPVMQPEKGNWEIRKNLLLATVNKVFDFGFLTDPVLIPGLQVPYTAQCDAFSALLYYTHILGDVIVLKDYAQYKKEGSYVLPLARDHADANNPDILWDLSTIYLPKLFSDNTKQTDEFKLLMNKLDDLAQKARKLVGQPGGINSEERFIEYKAYGEELMKILKDHISGLLWQEQFFKAVFPAE